MERKNIYKNYKNKYFIETGCFIGDGIQFAVDSGFENIYSIELSNKYYNIAKERFKDNPNVHLIKGDSAIILFDLIKDIDEKITFFLDGHFCFGDTAMGLYSAPLLQELEQIKKHHIKEHTILIDDVRTWKTENKSTYGFDVNDLITECKKINENYIILYEDGIVKNDIMIATI